MAVSHTTSSGQVTAMALQAKYGLDRVTITQDPLTPTTLVMADLRGQRKGISIALAPTANPSDYLKALDNAIGKLKQELDNDWRRMPAARQIQQIQFASNPRGMNTFSIYAPPDTLDLTANAIENIEDLMTLTDRAKAQGHPVKKAIVTKDQMEVLTNLTDDPANPTKGKSRTIAKFYGIKLEVRKS